MIEYALLIMLGFCVGGLIAFLLAPTLWHRAVRLTTKRLEATLPMSLSDIEADKDLLRASYAIKIRRLEAGLGKAREKSANQLVEISKLQMSIGELQDQMSDLELQLEERKNAANVFESTIRKRFPELEGAVAAAKTALEERAYEINDLTNKLRRRDEGLALAQRSVNLQQEEIRRLREAMEKTGSDTSGRFKRRPSQWTLDEYRSEYDRLNVELSKMREQLVLGHEREASQIAVLKTELQQLGEQIMSSVAAQDRESSRVRAPEPDPKPWLGNRPPQTATAVKRTVPGRPAAKAQPWPGSRPAPESRAPLRNPAPEASTPAPATPSPAAPSSTPRILTEPALGTSPATADKPRTSKPGDGVASLPNGEATGKRETRDALQSLLDRSAKFSDEDGSTVKTSRASSLTTALEPLVAERPEAAPDSEAGAVAETAAKPESKPEPKLDQMFREIFENRPSASPAPAATGPVRPSTTVAGASEPSSAQAAAPVEASDPDADKKRTLLDRLRVMHERQTG